MSTHTADLVLGSLSALFDFHKTDGASYPDEAGLDPGDSGSPSFMVWDNQLTLLATRFAVNNNDPDIRINAAKHNYSHKEKS